MYSVMEVRCAWTKLYMVVYLKWTIVNNQMTIDAEILKCTFYYIDLKKKFHCL